MEQLKEDTTPDNLQESTEKLIIVTGFGPFIGHEKINASWEAVRLLPDTLHYGDSVYRLEKQKISVEYAAVDEAVPAIWQRQPELVIHCGVHGQAACVHVENSAYNHEFDRADYAGKRLSTPSACLSQCRADNSNDVICTRLNVPKICAAIEKAATADCDCDVDGAVTRPQPKQPIKAKFSDDVGSYLCGYIYLKSLDMNSERSLFVHVPPVDRPFSSAHTSALLMQIIEECVRQINEDAPNVC